MSDTLNSLERALKHHKVHHDSILKAFRHTGFAVRDGLSYETFAAAWPGMPLERRVSYAACLIGPMHGISEQRAITRAYGDLCRTGRLNPRTGASNLASSSR